MANDIGLNSRTASRRLQIAKNITDDVQELLRTTEIADNQNALLAISRLTPILQESVANTVLSGEKYRNYISLIKDVKKKTEQNNRFNNSKDLDNPSIKLYNGDARDVLKTLLGKVADVIILDAPYGINYQKNGGWGEQDNLEESLNLLDSTLVELQRVSKPNAHLYIFCSWKMHIQFHTIISKYFDVVNMIIWDKGAANSSRCDFSKKYSNTYELIFYCKQQNNDERQLNNSRSDDVLNFDKTLRTEHGCEKPVELLSYLINNSSVVGETILDPFMGSGNSGLAAIKNGRKYIGIELDKKWFDFASDNINQAGTL